MLIGATARDLLLQNVFGKETLRKTQDVDIAVLIEDWPLFEQVRAEILAITGFMHSTSKPYRFHYKPDENALSVPVDIVPFGNIATEEKAFYWPLPHDRFFINVMWGVLRLVCTDGGQRIDLCD